MTRNHPGTRSKGHNRKGKRFERLDANGDGRITQSEIEENFNERFQVMEINGENVVTKEEVNQGKHHKGKYPKGDK